MKKLGFLLIFLMLCLTGIYFLLNPSKDEFVEGDLYDEITKRGVLRVGVNLESKPHAYVDSKGKIVGYDVDLARYIARYIVKSRDRVEFVPITTSNRLIKASTGDVDIVISTVTITPSRQEVVEFSVPYDSAGQAILVKSNSDIKSISDLSDQSVGVIFGTTAEKNMHNLVPSAKILGFRSYETAYTALKNGDINAITSDDTILSRFAIDDKDVKLLPKRYSREPYGIAFKKGNSTVKLKENLDFAVNDLKRKNVIARLRKKWDIYG